MSDEASTSTSTVTLYAEDGTKIGTAPVRDGASGPIDCRIPAGAVVFAEVARVPEPGNRHERRKRKASR